MNTSPFVETAEAAEPAEAAEARNGMAAPRRPALVIALHWLTLAGLPVKENT